MTARPITITEPQIGRLVAGELSVLRRPEGRMIGKVAAGDLLWVREPFHLPASHGNRAPTVAVAMGAVPIFVTELAGRSRQDVGKRRYARNLPRVSHRQHLVVSSVDREPLQDITHDEIVAEGFLDRGGFASAWDRNLSLTAWGFDWARNPTVLIIRFRRMASPVPEALLS